jgi:hypothetical protein
MKFFVLKKAFEEASIGSTYPQSQVAKNTVHIDDPTHLWKQNTGQSVVGVAIPQPVLHPDAILTDLISSASISIQLVLSRKLKSLLESYAVPTDIEFLPLTVWYLNKEHPYWVLNPLDFRMELIDFSKSEIWVVGIGGGKIRDAKVENYSDFVAFNANRVSSEWLRIRKVALKNQSDIHLFALQGVEGGIEYYVSDKLKNEIEDAGCTGITFEELIP